MYGILLVLLRVLIYCMINLYLIEFCVLFEIRNVKENLLLDSGAVL